MTKNKKTSVDQNDRIDEDKTNDCPHMRQSINLAHLKRGLKDCSKYGFCQKCDSDATKESFCIYICLQCGHQGCDRSSDHQHALKHFEACKSHSCAMNTENLQIWCYKCDDFKTSDMKNVQECSDLIFKLFKKETGEVSASADVEKLKSAGKAKAISPDPSKNIHMIPKVKGLSNLGNTCFFNSIMQCINQTYLFEQCLKAKINCEIELNSHSKDEDDEGLPQVENEGYIDAPPQTSASKNKTLIVKLGGPGGMTKSLLSFYEDMKWENKKNGVVSPGALFGSVCTKAPQFRGFQQQDSHEMLRHLLDGIREEEIKKLQTGILNAYNVTKEDKNSISDYKKKLIKDFGRLARHTTADEVFGGCFLSTVTCEECMTPHQIYESFLDISLPISVEQCSENELFSDTGKSFKTYEKFSKKNAPEEKPHVSKHMSKKEKKNAKKLMKQLNKKTKPQKLTLKQFNEMQEGGDSTTNPESANEKEDEEGADEDRAEEDEGRIEDDLVEKATTMNLVGGKSETEEDRPPKESNHILSNGHTHPSSDDDNDYDDAEAKDASWKKIHEGLECINQETVEPNWCAIAHVVPSIEEGAVHEYLEDFDYSYHSVNERKLLAMKMGLIPLGDRQIQKSCSLTSCLHQFTSPEFLLDNNKYLCDHCNKKSKGAKHPKYTVARRQVLIYAPPAILTLHLKRFQQTLSSFKKLNNHVPFPEILDLAPYCSSLAKNISAGQRNVLYSLYGVVEHSGSMKGGHYTAYVKVREESKDAKKFLQALFHDNFSSDLLVKLMLERRKQDQKFHSPGSMTFLPGKWFHVSDSHVSEVKDVSNVLRCQAYILFYERIL